ncbi:L-serine ammonia-lyase [Endozoicomonas sp. SCSIO W0465]|uniref:L-serine ammonia-lyase n=1 Tax=Endozoicomonas sp. SCSIO W0465 TaxID=2918516 RepID=UPI002076273B|nr:L-serine ammonia-lyase [Endozoicomonas sp. SCSIO W0465]USE39736.1 L-serine ammonia-lyase [Endozoicomonas sp. SCSIO W0465]
MGLSILDLFKIGVGPSSSHTVGPMVAANRFLDTLIQQGQLEKTRQVRVELYGSLAMTGAGHATDTAVILGLMGEKPDQLNPDQAPDLINEVRRSGELMLASQYPIPFVEDQHFHFLNGHSLPKHPNGMTIRAFDEAGLELFHDNYYSVGGGFVLNEQETDQAASSPVIQVPFPFNNAEDLLDIGDKTALSIGEIVLENEQHLGRTDNIRQALLNIWQAMDSCIKRGCQQTGILPGGLNVRRRAHQLHQELLNRSEDQRDHLEVMDWVNLFAIAVNEENAVGGRVVTAPTNGAAGVIPAVLAYYDRFVPDSSQEGICTFLATAAAIGMLYKKNASISAAEVGCQGEIGVACSMAAGALCAVMGGNNRQIENAAEIGMEHNLGLTCDPIAGLVQVPCIERNTMGAVKAINAARLAMKGDGQHRVSLDDVIETMRQTGLDMQDKYKETATGGLAVNVVIC